MRVNKRASDRLLANPSQKDSRSEAPTNQSLNRINHTARRAKDSRLTPCAVTLSAKSYSRRSSFHVTTRSPGGAGGGDGEGSSVAIHWINT